MTLIEHLPSCSSLTTFLYLASSSPYCWRSSANSFRTSLQRFRGQGRLDLGSFAAILLLEGWLTDWVLKWNKMSFNYAVNPAKQIILILVEEHITWVGLAWLLESKSVTTASNSAWQFGSSHAQSKQWETRLLMGWSVDKADQLMYNWKPYSGIK